MQTKMDQIRDDLADAFRGEVKDLAQWAERNWCLDIDRDVGDESGMTAEQIVGWNKCLQSLSGMIEGWLGEEP